MNQYTYFILGTIFGLAIAIRFFIGREEKIENTIKFNQQVFSTEKLDNTMEIVVDRIKYKINELERDLTEDEKNEIIKQCCREKFNL